MTHEEKCLFRATRQRLTLRCVPAESGWPNEIFDPEGDPETTVLFRLE